MACYDSMINFYKNVSIAGGLLVADGGGGLGFTLFHKKR